MTAEFEKRLTARRYSELLAVAESMLKSAGLIDEILNDDKKLENEVYLRVLCCLPDRASCYAVALDYSVSALEAFINHIGYIFCDDWSDHETKIFWLQYKVVINYLITQGVQIASEMVASPYADFAQHRNKRNLIHHPHASEHDHAYEKGEIQHSYHDMQVGLNMLYKTWVSITPVEARAVYDHVKLYIQSVSALIKQALNNVKVPTDPGRKKLFNDVLDNPFKPAVVKSIGDSNRVHIIVNSKIKLLARRLFTAAHEIGHVVLHLAGDKKVNYKCSSEDIREGNIIESEANQFASALLLPKYLIDEKINQNNLTWSLIEEVAKKYKTSLEVAARRVINLSKEMCALIIHDKNTMWNPVRSKSFSFYIPKSGFPSYLNTRKYPEECLFGNHA